MKIIGTENSNTVMKEMGKRLRTFRINLPMTQEELAHESDLSLRTIQRMEKGESVQTESLIRVLRTMGILANMESLIPAEEARPSDLFSMGKKRQRALSPKHRIQKKPSENWTWGEDK